MLAYKEDAYSSDEEKNRCAGEDQATPKFYVSMSTSNADDEAAKEWAMMAGSVLEAFHRPRRFPASLSDGSASIVSAKSESCRSD